MASTYVHLKHRGVLQLTGADRYDLLQGLITNDVHKVKKNGIIFAALLSPQGRFLHDFFVIEKEDTLYLTPERERLPDLLSKLAMYKLRSDVDIKDVSDEVAVGWSLEEGEGRFVDPRHEGMGYVCLGEEGGGFLEDYDRHRMKLVVPDGSRDLVVDKAVILEHNYNEHHALDWDKGCYLGQELMARTHHRGMVRKKLYAVQGDNLPAFGETLFSGDKKAGVMKSSCGDLGLALLYVDLSGDVHATHQGTNIFLKRH